MKILSIDPGYERMGIAILEKQTKKHDILFSECFKTDKNIKFEERITLAGNHLEKLLKKYKPECVAIEKLFFSKNKKTALKIAEVMGIYKYVTQKHGLEIFEYTPSQIKSAITGNGNANKKQIMQMVPHFVNIDERKRLDDEYDAIAIGITHISVLKSVEYKYI